MAFVADPKNFGRVFDAEHNLSLTEFTRDVPQGECWFDFSINGVDFYAKTTLLVSKEEKTFIYTCDVNDLEKNFRSSLRYSSPKYNPTSQEFRSTVLPPLRDAIAYLNRRQTSASADGNLWKVDVQFSCKDGKLLQLLSCSPE